jgi:ATP-dependent protease ClpP protease subunit
MLTLQAANDNVTELRIYRPIGPLDDMISVEDVSAAIEGHTGKLRVRINSYGGDAYEGIAIYNVLRELDDVDTVVDGMAGSAASVIMMSGKRRIMGSATQMMIHLPRAIVAGESSDLRTAAERMDKLTDDVAKIYSDSSSLSVQQVMQAMKRTTYYKAAEAKKLGFATELAQGKSAIAASAKDLDYFRKLGWLGEIPDEIVQSTRSGDRGPAKRQRAIETQLLRKRLDARRRTGKSVGRAG